MLSAVVALSLTPIAYAFGSGTTTNYYVRVGLNGYLPLLGGRQGQAEVDLAVSVKGLAPASSGESARSELTEFQIKFNGAQFPVDLETAKGYFPSNTVLFSPQGRVVKNDAPDEPLPVRLPGLDRKRIPDITYLPIEFPSDGIEAGKSWTFVKTFDGVDLNYTVTPTTIKEEVIDLKIELKEHDEYFEDADQALLATDNGAAFKVVADLTGSGTASFDRKQNLVSTVAIKMENLSKETDLKTGTVTPHSLVTTLDISQGKPLPPSMLSLARVDRRPGSLGFLADKIEQSRPVQSALVAAQLMHPSRGMRRSAIPFVGTTVNDVYVVSQRAIQRQFEQFTVLAGDRAAGIPELLDVQNVHTARSFLGSLPSVVRTQWRPYYERANGLANQFIQYISPHDASPSQAARIIRNQNQYKPCFPTSKIKPLGKL